MKAGQDASDKCITEDAMNQIEYFQGDPPEGQPGSPERYDPYYEDPYFPDPYA